MKGVEARQSRLVGNRLMQLFRKYAAQCGNGDSRAAYVSGPAAPAAALIRRHCS